MVRRDGAKPREYSSGSEHDRKQQRLRKQRQRLRDQQVKARADQTKRAAGGLVEMLEKSLTIWRSVYQTESFERAMGILHLGDALRAATEHKRQLEAAWADVLKQLAELTDDKEQLEAALKEEQEHVRLLNELNERPDDWVRRRDHERALERINMLRLKVQGLLASRGKAGSLQGTPSRRAAGIHSAASSPCTPSTPRTASNAGPPPPSRFVQAREWDEAQLGPRPSGWLGM